MVERLLAVRGTEQTIADLTSWNVYWKMFECKIETQNAANNPYYGQVIKMITN